METVVTSKEALLSSYCWEGCTRTYLVVGKEPGLQLELLRTFVWTLYPSLSSQPYGGVGGVHPSLL